MWDWPSGDRFGAMEYRPVGRSGLLVSALSLGCWYGFGDDRGLAEQRDVLRTAFDHGVTHLDLASNYGLPVGAAEVNVGRHLRELFGSLRDELVVSTKAGHWSWPGPYGEWGSRKHVRASLDRSLRRLGLDYVDIFYSHRPDPATPLEETMTALHDAVRSGKALYVGISQYDVQQTCEAARILADLGTPLLVHQPVYSLLNRWTEQGSPSLHEALQQLGVGCITFSPLAQGLLSNRYADGVPAGSRAAGDEQLAERARSEAQRRRVEELGRLAAERGQTLAQMAIAWVLRSGPSSPAVSSVLLGASSVGQLREDLGALQNTAFTPDELVRIDELALGVRV